jgi:hypothetical protein
LIEDYGNELKDVGPAFAGPFLLGARNVRVEGAKTIYNLK